MRRVERCRSLRKCGRSSVDESHDSLPAAAAARHIAPVDNRPALSPLALLRCQRRRRTDQGRRLSLASTSRPEVSPVLVGVDIRVSTAREDMISPALQHRDVDVDLYRVDRGLPPTAGSATAACAPVTRRCRAPALSEPVAAVARGTASDRPRAHRTSTAEQHRSTSRTLCTATAAR
jgi:hypothetical protein